MKLRIIFWAVLGSIASGLLYWRNAHHYPAKSVIWRILKSVSELFLLVLSAVSLPIVLISWCTVWFTRPIRTPWIRTTVGTVAGVVLGFISLCAAEVLILVGVFSMDDITGEHAGFLKNFHRAKQAAARA